MAAAKRNQIEVVSMLLSEANCDVMAKDSKGLTAKDMAIAKNHVSVVQEIKRWQFKYNLDPNDSPKKSEPDMDVPLDNHPKAEQEAKAQAVQEAKDTASARAKAEQAKKPATAKKAKKEAPCKR